MSDEVFQCAICDQVLDDEWIQIIVKDASGYTVGFLHHEHLIDYAARVGALETNDE